MKKYKCCICGKEKEGYGNSPYGAVDEKTKKILMWKEEDVCCDLCNIIKVIPGRIYLIKN